MLNVVEASGETILYPKYKSVRITPEGCLQVIDEGTQEVFVTYSPSGWLKAFRTSNE